MTNKPYDGTRLVDGVPVATAASMDDAPPAIRLTDDWDAAYHEDKRLIDVVVRNAGPDGEHLFMELDDVVRAVPRAQLEDAIRAVKTDGAAAATGDPARTAATLRKTRDLLAAYRRILESDAMLGVFQMSQIHGAPYSGEQIETKEVDAAIADADRILGGHR